MQQLLTCCYQQGRCAHMLQWSLTHTHTHSMLCIGCKICSSPGYVVQRTFAGCGALPTTSSGVLVYVQTRISNQQQSRDAAH